MTEQKKTILVTGAFNPLHFGHLLLLKDASSYGDVIVALNSDEWVIRNKGYLHFDFKARKQLLEECKYVSKVVSFDDSDNDVCGALLQVRPTYFGNGGAATSASVPKQELEVCGYLGIEAVFNLGGIEVNPSKIFAIQKSIINHSNCELQKLENNSGSNQ
jgi:cytidyltransferase-like protein